jgi:hypothetical protein
LHGGTRRLSGELGREAQGSGAWLDRRRAAAPAPERIAVQERGGTNFSRRSASANDQRPFAAWIDLRDDPSTERLAADKVVSLRVAHCTHDDASGALADRSPQGFLRFCPAVYFSPPSPTIIARP